MTNGDARSKVYAKKVLVHVREKSISSTKPIQNRVKIGKPELDSLTKQTLALVPRNKPPSHLSYDLQVTYAGSQKAKKGKDKKKRGRQCVWDKAITSFLLMSKQTKLEGEKMTFSLTHILHEIRIGKIERKK